ncbi:anthrone oxygenase family protein [Deinococcus sp.]|uniref:anthrone oxygenase family protein n=1 Tax=Deinococcus sp. TaxID=47478 RepID=UPI003B5C639D
MQEVLVIATVVFVGLMVGVELSVAAFVNPIFDRLPNDGGVAARSDGARLLGRVMPLWYIGAVVLGAVWTVQAWGHPQALTVAVAAALLALSVVMSVTLLVPINSQVARWSSQGVPPDWRQQVGRWDRLHFVRVGVLIAAFVLLVAGAA